MEEKIHHEDDQNDRFDKRLDHLVDRQANERRRVIRNDSLEAFGEKGFEFRKPCPHAICRVERIGTYSKPDRDTGSRRPIIAANRLVIFRADLHTRHILQAHLRAVFVHAQQYVLKLLGRFEACLRGDRCVELLAFHRRPRAELACGDFSILSPDSSSNVGDRHAEALHLLRIDPDAHCMLRPEKLHLANAIHAA